MPTVTLSSAAPSVTGTSPITVTATFSESVTGFVVGDLTIGNGSASGFSGSGTTYTFDVTPSAAGTVTVNVAGSVAVDAAGNNNSAATQLSRTYDNVAPTAGSFSASTGVSDTAFTLNWSTGSDAVTSTANLEYLVCTGASAAAIDTVGECDNAPNIVMSYATNTTTYAVTGRTASTTYYYNVVVRDGVGNRSLYNGITQATNAPPGYRYYRVVIDSVLGSNCCAIYGVSSIKFRWAGTWQTNAMVTNNSGTIGGLNAVLSSASEYSLSYQAYQAFNGSYTIPHYSITNTFASVSPFDASPAGSQWIKVDLGIGNYRDIDGIKLFGAGTYALDAYYLQGSNDDFTWTTVGPGLISGDTSTEQTTTWNNTPPPNPTGLSGTADINAAVTLSWTSGGGSTASFKIAYQTGATAPATCNAGTTTTSASSPRTISGLAGLTQYSFRVCAVDADSGLSSGVTTTLTTTAAPPGYRYVRVVINSVVGTNSNQIYGVEYIQFRWNGAWQTNAMTAPASGSIGGFNATVSEGSSLYSDPANYGAHGSFKSSVPYSYSAHMTFSDSSPFNAVVTDSQWIKVDFGVGNTPNISGIKIKGIATLGYEPDEYYVQGSNDDTSWTTLGPGVISGSTNTEQTTTWSVGAPPPNPSGLSGTADVDAAVTLSWTSGGGSTASFKIAYQTGATAPATCNAGTTVTSASSPRTISNLAGLTQYSFRVCSVNADGELSSGVTTSLTTTPALPGYRYVRVVISSLDGNSGFYGVEYIQFRWNNTWQANAMISPSSGTIGGFNATVSEGSSYANNQTAYGAYGSFRSYGPYSYSAWGSFSSSHPFDEVTSESQWLKVDFGDGNRPNISGIKFKGYSSNLPDEYYVQGSNDNISWTTLGPGVISGSTATEQTTTWSVGAPPPNPTGLSGTADVGAAVTLSWTSGGGSTASFKIAYQTGATAPADCNSGTTTTSASSPRTISGLAGLTQYSFRVCAVDAENGISTGVTTTLTTTAAPSGYRYYRLMVESLSDNQGVSMIFRIFFKWDGVWQTNSMSGPSSGTIGSFNPTITESSAGGGQPGWFAFNNVNAWVTDANTFSTNAPFNFIGAEPQWVKVDFGAGNAPNITGVQIAAYSYGAPDVFYLQGSNDNSTWTTVSDAPITQGTYGGPWGFTWGSGNGPTAPNPTGATADNSTPGLIRLNWTSGGANSVFYSVSVLAGPTAPPTCGNTWSSGTLSSPSSDWGGATGQNYSFRICAANADKVFNNTGIVVENIILN